MEYICTPFVLVPSNLVSDTLPCCERGISSDCQEALWNFSSQSSFSNRSSHTSQVQMWCIEQEYGWTPWNFALQLCCQQDLADKGLGPTEGEDHTICLILLDAFQAWQRQACNRADLQGRSAETCHKLSCCPAQLLYLFQDGCSPLGRSRREQVQMEEDCLPCQESGELGGAPTHLKSWRHL